MGHFWQAHCQAQHASTSTLCHAHFLEMNEWKCEEGLLFLATLTSVADLLCFDYCEVRSRPQPRALHALHLKSLKPLIGGRYAAFHVGESQHARSFVNLKSYWSEGLGRRGLLISLPMRARWKWKGSSGSLHFYPAGPIKLRSRIGVSRDYGVVWDLLMHIYSWTRPVFIRGIPDLIYEQWPASVPRLANLGEEISKASHCRAEYFILTWE